MKTAPAPGSKEWVRTLTASKIGTIMGVNPYKTPNELWLEMSGMVEPETLNDADDRLLWGHCAEDSLVEYWQAKNDGWQTNKGEVTYTDPDLPFANFATLDRRAINRKLPRSEWFHIIECKTSDSQTTWADGLPAQVAAQGMGQMGISGIHKWSAVVQLHSTVPKIFPMAFDQELWMDGMVPTIERFIRTLGDDEPPAPPADVVAALSDRRMLISFEDDVNLAGDDPDYLRWLDLTEQKRALEEELAQLQNGLDSWADGRKVTVDGAPFMTPIKGRFAAKRMPDEYKYLLKHPDMQSLRFDPKKLQDKHPDIYRLSLGEDSYRFKEAS